jgi:hypothetical protein
MLTVYLKCITELPTEIELFFSDATYKNLENSRYDLVIQSY